MNLTDNNNNRGGGPSTSPQALYQELEALLGNVYADLAVSREHVKGLVEKGRTMADEGRAGTTAQAEEFLKALEGMERKINQALDIRRLKEEGLVKAIKL